MNLTTIKGDLFQATRGLIIHGCNAQGVMGSGVAAYVKQKYPNAYQVYKREHEQKGLAVGTCTWAPVGHELWVVNAVTQNTFGPGLQTDYEGLARCFDTAEYLAQALDEFVGGDMLPLHFPKIGAGRGGGDWNIILKKIEDAVNPARPLFLYVVDEEPTYTRAR
jgi:O-acetyl-ADP-ribose deacetylase (regulator of RNase III)